MRRRERPRPEVDRPVPPDWCLSLLAGLRYASHAGHRGLADQLPFLRAQRDRWCRQNGCYHAGKPCVEVYGSGCRDAA